MRLGGKAAIVTGAGRAIGKATALQFAREGVDVLVPDLEPATSHCRHRALDDHPVDPGPPRPAFGGGSPVAT